MQYIALLTDATVTTNSQGAADGPWVGAALAGVAVFVLIVCVGGFIWSMRDDRKKAAAAKQSIDKL